MRLLGTLVCVGVCFYCVCGLKSVEKKLRAALESKDLEEAISDFVSIWKDNRAMGRDDDDVGAMMGDDPASYSGVSPNRHGVKKVEDSVILFHSNSTHVLELARNPSKFKTEIIKLIPSDVARKKVTKRARSNEIPYSTKSPNRTNCSICAYRDKQKKMRLDIIKVQILKRLRIDMIDIPKITGPVLTFQELSELPFMQSFFEMPSDDPYAGGFSTDADYDGAAGTDDFHATTLRVVNFGQPLPSTMGMNSKDVCHFSFQPQVTRSKVARAHLWVFLKKYKKGPLPRGSRINIFRMMPPTKPGGDLVPIRIKSKKILRNGWYRFDFRSVVQRWIWSPKTNYGLKITAYPYGESAFNGESLAVVQPTHPNEEVYKPSVEIKIKERRANRRKRNPGIACDETSTETRCCRFPLTVDFVEFGWDWVIAPKRYNANFCSGDCPGMFSQKNLHTHVVQQANPGRSYGPCCTPTKLSPMSLLYLDNKKNILFGRLPNVVVENCGCQ